MFNSPAFVMAHRVTSILGKIRSFGAGPNTDNKKQSGRGLQPFATAAVKSVAAACFCVLAFPVAQPARAAMPLMALPGQANVDPLGGFTYTVPIKAPPGTNGMVPHVALTYSSRGGDGPAGLGWSISGQSAITRCPQTYAQDGQPGGVTYTSSDRFCLDGQRLILVSGTYGANNSTYRTEIESFRKIVFHTSGTNCGVSCFDVQTRDGTDYQYGYTASAYGSSGAQVYANGTNNIVRVWALSQVTDTKGNYIAYTYTDVDSDADYVLSRIDYTGNSGSGGNSPYNSIRFVYQARTNDETPQYQAGYLIEKEKLLTDVETYHLAGQMILDYKLAYNAPPTSSHYEVSGITLYDNASHSIAPTTFTWQGSENNPTETTASISTLGVIAGQGLTAGDFNGDGLTDAFIQDTECLTGGAVYYGSQSNTFSSAGMTASYDRYQTGTQTPVHYSGPACFQNTDSVPGDVDGDGISDLGIDVNYWTQGVPTQLGEILKTSGTNFSQLTQDGQFTWPFIIRTSNTGFPADFDGDGRSDVINNGIIQLSNGDGSYTSGPTAPIGEYYGDFDGDGCTDFLDQGHTNTITYSPVCNPNTPAATVPDFDGTPVLGDFNGDGKTDILIADSSGAHIYLSTGAGLVEQYTIPGSTSWWSTYTIVAGDFNGDGKADIALIPISGGTGYIYLSTGTGFNQLASLTSLPAGSPVIADWNNDGAADLIIQPAGTPTGVMFSYTPELIHIVSNGIGATTTVSYDRLNHGTIYTKGSGAVYPMQDVDAAIYVVSSLQAMGGGTSKSWSYAYTGLEKDLHGRGLLGFRQIQTTDQLGIIRTTKYGRGGASGMTFPFNTLVYSDVSKSGSTTINSVANSWGMNDSIYCPNENNNLNAVVCLEQTVASGTDPDGGQNWPTTTTNYTYDGYGNILDKKSQVVSGNQSYTNDTADTWNIDIADWVLNQPATTVVTNTNSNGNLQRQYSFTEANGHTGEVTRADIEPENENNNDDSTWLTINYGHDNWGNVTSTGYSGWNIAQGSSVQYDTNGEFPTLLTNALNETETPTYGQFWGNDHLLVDYNNNTSTWLDDTFGDPASFTAVDGTMATFTNYYCNGLDGGAWPSPYTCPSNAAFVTVTTHAGAAVNGTALQNAPTTLVFYDALGRVIAQDTQAFDGNWNQTDTEYDSNGYLAKTSKPYETTLSTAQCPTGSVCTSYSNDILGRPQTVSYPNDQGGTSNTTYQYEALTTIVTNALNQATTTTENVQGLVASVTDANSEATTYSYDAFGDLLKVNTPDVANQVQNSYDVRGRKITSSDADLGSNWQYSYDALGELVSQTSARENYYGKTTTLGYDALGRLTSRIDPDMTATWCYDGLGGGVCPTTPNAVGRLTQASCSGNACAGVSGSQGYSRTYTYDTFSRQSTVTVDYPLAGGSFTSTETYDGTGGTGTGTELPKTITAYSGFQYNYGYNSVGYTSQITDTNSGATYWTANAMDASGHLTQETAGNGVVTTRAYWPESGRVEQINAETTPGQGQQAQTVTNISYTWDTIGNLTERDDTYNGIAESFCYNDNPDGSTNVLNRLTNSSINGSGAQACMNGSYPKTIAYDNDGNITSKSDVGSYTYGGTNQAGPHAVTAIATNAGKLVDGVANPTLVYELDGMLKCITSGADCTTAARSYGWTWFDMASTITEGADTVSLNYDPEHNRGELADSSSGNNIWYYKNPAAGAMSEMLQGSTTTWRDYLVAYGHIVAERFYTGGVASMYYFVGDHLSSTTTLTDASQNQKEYDAYDAWGKRRNAKGTDINNCIYLHPASMTLRGFTGQEEMDSLCLVNLNARMYDPSLGRMLGADATVPYPMSGQSYNRFSYVVNNPLAFADPTGHTNEDVDGTSDDSDIQCTDGCGTDATGDGSGTETVTVTGQRWTSVAAPGGMMNSQYFPPGNVAAGLGDGSGSVIETVTVVHQRSPQTQNKPMITISLPSFNTNGMCSRSVVGDVGHAVFEFGRSLSKSADDFTIVGTGTAVLGVRLENPDLLGMGVVTTAVGEGGGFVGVVIEGIGADAEYLDDGDTSDLRAAAADTLSDFADAPPGMQSDSAAQQAMNAAFGPSQCS